MSLLLICAAVVSAGVLSAIAVQRNKITEMKQQFRARIRDGVGAEVHFARQDDDHGSIQASVDSAAQFIFKRSGLKLTEHTKKQLAGVETRTLAGEQRRITPEELSDILAVIALERISGLRDTEIEYAAEILRGFDAPDLPDSFRRSRQKRIKMRSSRTDNLSPDKFIAQVKAIQKADEASREIFLGAAKSAASVEIQNRIKLFAEAAPEQFGTAANGLTPLQALLLTYSVASDDLLYDSTSNLKKSMKARQDKIMKDTGESYPSPAGHLAYGTNGYIFSTPLDLVLDEQTTDALLSRIAERSVNK